MHLTVGIFGNQDLAKRLGKKDTINDIAIYSHSSSEGVFTYICPNSEKIQSLLQVLNMIDVPVLVIDNLTKEIGEMIVGINEMNFEKGFIVTDIRDAIQPLIKNTCLEKFEIIGENDLWPKLLSFNIERHDDFLMIPIDNYFNVKGVGTVILGIIKSGKISLHEKLIVEPIGKEVIAKGIQSQDKDIEEAGSGMRIGLNIKGVEVEELKRGFVIVKDKVEKSSEIVIKFKKNRFFKQEIKQDIPVLLSIGLQVVSCTIESTGSELKLKSDQKIAYRKNQRCIVASQNDIMPRIIGNGIII
jgi:selenocysteine-specific translation elongation factor